jgi:hypothetical protein
MKTGKENIIQKIILLLIVLTITAAFGLCGCSNVPGENTYSDKDTEIEPGTESIGIVENDEEKGSCFEDTNLDELLDETEKKDSNKIVDGSSEDKVWGETGDQKEETDEEESIDGESNQEVNGDIETSVDESNIDEEEYILPDIKLEIYQGPEHAQEGSICYYRIKAIVSGIPEPNIIFSKDDSNGTWGNNISQVNLQENESYTLTATAVNSLGEASSFITLDWVEMEQQEDEQETEEVDFSSSNFKINVDLTNQIVIVYYKGGVLKEMVCSGGTPGNPTPLGNFTTTQKIYYSWLPKYSVGAYYFVRFYGSYLFHSVPFDSSGNMIIEEYEKLGTPASHGCIRLAVEDAKWIYENLPLEVEVFIY